MLALLDHLGCPPDLRESMVGEKPEGLYQYSSSGHIPLLVHGDLVLTESRVMLEHLAEHYGLDEAYPADLGARSLHRHAMAVVDVFLAPLLFTPTDTDVDAPGLDDALRALEDATASAAPNLACWPFTSRRYGCGSDCGTRHMPSPAQSKRAVPSVTGSTPPCSSTV